MRHRGEFRFLDFEMRWFGGIGCRMQDAVMSEAMAPLNADRIRGIPRLTKNNTPSRISLMFGPIRHVKLALVLVVVTRAAAGACRD